jgi:hypothetical protein
MTNITTKLTSKKVAVIQSNYLPWAGYFAVMASVDLFVVYECVQYTKNDWRNRNQIEAPDGNKTWLSIPVRQVSATQPFMETTVSRPDWATTHFKTLHHCFARTPGWIRWRKELEGLYKNAGEMTHLFEINRLFLNWAVATLGLRTPLVYLDSYPEHPDPNQRLISILQYFGATHYLSGPAAQNYIAPELFADAHIDISYVNYDQLIKKILTGPEPVKTTSILQIIIEGRHEFRSH